MNEVTTPTESTTTPPVGTSASQISRNTQDDTSDRPVSMDEDEEEDYETDSAQRTASPVQRLARCARIGGQLCG